MNMLIDSHCHLPHELYKLELDNILKEAYANDVAKFISIGTSSRDSLVAISTAQKYDQIYATLGIYPHEDLTMDLAAIYGFLVETYDKHRENIVGIGECGIDLNYEKVSYETRELTEQAELFKLQLGFAVDRDLPVIIHNRNGNEEVLSILALYKNTNLRGVLHCFVSDWDFANKVLHYNFYISFTAIITYPSAGEALLDAVRKVPLNKILLETDAPWLPPQGHRGEINYPKYVKIVAEKVAEIKGLTYEEVAKQTYKNTCDLFSIC